ncbi:MAG: hypothetical protein K2H40_14265 [Lachnospiraceae bacterium]|nr:hypothetical protein [Lachnospiraceae bacterium]
MSTIQMNRETWISIIAKKAQEDWQARHLCLPSLVIAMALHDSPVLFPLRRDGHSGTYPSVEAAVMSHNTYLAEWKAGGQDQPNWKGLAGQEHYILAVQYLQDAQYPYYPSKGAESELVELIERNRLGRYD